MFSRFDQASLKSKIVVTTTIPIIAYLLVSLIIVIFEGIDVYRFNKYQSRLDQVSHLSEIIMFTQLERGKSLVHMGSSNIDSSLVVAAQSETDASISRLEKKYKGHSELMEKIEAMRSAVSENRRAVAELEPRSKVLQGFTKLIFSMIDLQTEMVQSTNVTLTGQGVVLINLEKARESAGKFRALVSATFAKDLPITIGALETIIEHKKNLHFNLLENRKLHSQKFSELYNKFSTQNHWTLQDEYFETLIALANEGAYGEEGAESFATLTKVVNDIGSLINLQLDHLSEVAHEAAGFALAKVVANSITMLLVLGAIILLFLRFLKRFNTGFKLVMSELGSANTNIEKRSDIIQVSAKDLTAASHEATSAVQETVSSMTEMSSMVATADKKVKMATESSVKVTERVKDGEESISQLSTSMEQISDATDRLSEINEIIDQITDRTAVINEIVFKTQLLSFNASIEAAKAGEHGRGFSVVAEEVGKLADMSGQAASQISALLSDSRKKIANSIKYNQKIIHGGLERSSVVNATFTQISEGIDQIESNTKDIMDASNEQRLGIDQITTAVGQIDESIQQNLGRAQESETLALALANDNKRLVSAMAELFTLVNGTNKTLNKHPNESGNQGGETSGEPPKGEVEEVSTAAGEPQNPDKELDADGDYFRPVA